MVGLTENDATFRIQKQRGAIARRPEQIQPKPFFDPSRIVFSSNIFIGCIRRRISFKREDQLLLSTFDHPGDRSNLPLRGTLLRQKNLEEHHKENTNQGSECQGDKLDIRS